MLAATLPTSLAVWATDWSRSGATVEELMVYNYSHHTIDNGLNSNNVQTLMIDHEGKVWAGTNDGASVYDGYSFLQFNSEDDDASNSINGKMICDIEEFDDRSVCFAVTNGGLSLYDRYECRFRNDNKMSAALKMVENGDDLIYGIYKDSIDTYLALIDRIVIYTLGKKTLRHIPITPRRQYSDMTHHKIKFEPLPTPANATHLERMALHISTRNIGILDCKKLKVKTFTLPYRSINDICAVDNNHVLLATDKGLYIYNIDENRAIYEARLGEINIHALAKASGTNFWLAHSNNQLICWNPIENHITNITNSGNFLNQQTIVNQILCDPNGLIWIASNNTGLIKFDSKRPRIETVSIKSELPSSHATFDLFVSNHNDIWAACGKDGVLQIDPTTGKSKLIKLPQESVYSVFVRRNGEIYFDTWAGFELYNPVTDEHHDVSLTLSDKDSLTRIVVNDITEDCLGNVWLGTQQGVYRYNGRKAIKMNNCGLTDDNVNVVYEDLDGRIWVGNRLGSFVKEPNDTMFVETAASGLNRGATNNTLCFCDCGKDVLIGTTSGIIVYNKETRKVRSSNFNKKFGNALIYSILIDENEVIWLSTNSGIAYHDTNTDQSQRLNHYDGLAYQSNQSRKLHLFGDKIYFGRADQLNVIDVNNTHTHDLPPTTCVSTIYYGQAGEETRLKRLNDSTFVTKFLVKASLHISLSSSDLSVPQRNEYIYRLDNGDPVDLGSNNQIILSSLMPGLHKIEVRSTNSAKVMSDKSLIFYIDIKPQLWLTKAAIVFYIIMSLSLLWLLVTMRFRRMTRKYKQIEAEARAKRIVEAQRNKLAKIHKDQTDSINYAKRIQDSIMPKDTATLSWFNKLFVFYKPKDIVSGDFYCFYNRGNKVYLIAGDCTGHGVPGAFISILGIDHLYDIIMKNEDRRAGEILTALHSELNELIFKNTATNDNFNESIDITISIVYKDEMKLDFAGAMNDLYMIRDNEIKTYRGDRYSIGTRTSISDETEPIEFSSQLIECQKGDIFYMCSDGYVDQFGGPEQKKFKHRRFKHLLLNIHDLPALDQKQLLHQRHEEWKGKNEQVDDMLVMGFQPWS